MRVKKEELIQKLENYVKEIKEKEYFGFYKCREMANYLIIFLYNNPDSKTLEKFRKFIERSFYSWFEFEKKAHLYFANPPSDYEFIQHWINKDDVPGFFEVLDKHEYTLKTTKERLINLLKDLINNANSEFSKIADCFVKFLYIHQNSKTMEDFVYFIETEAPEWLNKEITWDPFFGVIDENKFIESWVNKSQIEIFKKFLKEGRM
jgi:predicted hydrocarbon binding protein